jgi:hypothetical protein
MEDGAVAKSIVELLHKTNEIIDDGTWIQANDGSTHKTTVRTGLPTATWRLLNYGVQPSKSTTAQIKDACGMLENYSEIDKSLADLNGNSAEFRLSEDMAFLEGMNQAFADTLFYGSTQTNPERFLGLSQRYPNLSASQSSTNVISAGGTGATNTSIWLIVWGPNTAHFIYPNGSAAGLQMKDLGEHTLFDPAGGRYQGYRTHFKWDCGFTLRDWRYAVRIANIDVTQLKANPASQGGPDLVDLMVQALEKVPNLNMGRPVFYVGRNVRSYLRRQVVNKPNLRLELNQVSGQHMLMFDEVPVRRCDSILSTEAALV